MSFTRLIFYLAASGLTSATVLPRMLDSNAQAFAASSFDFVIVGGGTAGITVASRLAENPNIKVGVIEAGMYRPNDTTIDVPNSQGYIGNAAYDWGFTSTLQEGLNNRSMYLARGKLVGGSSGINGLAWRRAAADDYDAWSAVIDDESWTFDSLLPYFKKSENWTAPTIIYPGQTVTPASTGSQGTGGPIEVSYNNYVTDLDIPLVSSAVNCGWDFNDSPNGGNSSGISPLARDVSPTLGVRFYAAPGYFAPAEQDSNLIVLTGAQATKINFATIKGQIIASSVDFVVAGQKYTVRASKEVILSAGQSLCFLTSVYILTFLMLPGALKTPQLLEVSGVGNATLLSSLGISSILDLPQIGENLQDHPLIANDFNVRPGFKTLDQLRINSTFANEAANEYATSRTGPLTYTFSFFAAVPLQSVVNASQATSLLAQLDSEIAATTLTPLQKVQYAHQRAAFADGKIGTVGYSLVASGGLASTPGANSSYLTLVAAAMQPFSRGSVHINSQNATLAPTIDVGYLKFDFDADVVTAGLKFTEKWTSTAPLSEMISGPNVPSASQYQSDADLKEYVRDSLIAFNHLAGTTAMAPKEIGGVVDSHLMVYGLQNVRVVDAGIFPMLITAPLQPTVYAIAEKAADMIKAAWNL
ncbi:alcohol oxidase [Mycena latifolia]|nr:alcohol oxidase [Mycena latifolia]